MVPGLMPSEGIAMVPWVMPRKMETLDHGVSHGCSTDYFSDMDVNQASIIETAQTFRPK